MNSSNIYIKKVENKKELKTFVNFVLKLYKKCPYYVPMIYQDEMALLDEDNGYTKKSCEHVFFLAFKDNQVVGRIQGIIPKDVNIKNNQKRVRFTRFACIDDQDVANALFDIVKDWGKEKGMTEMVGPLGYSDAEREGLLVEGFEELGTYEEEYNYPYYPALLENYGFVKDIDWIEFQLKLNENKTNAALKYYDRIMAYNKVHMVPKMSKKALFERYTDKFFHLIDVCYKDLYGTCDFTEETRKQLMDSFSILLNNETLNLVVNEEDELVAFVLWTPSLSKALANSKGNLLNPVTLIKTLHSIKHPKVFDFCLCGIDPRYRGQGLDIVYLKAANDIWHKYKLDHFETNLNLETNEKILSEWQRFDSRQNKRRRAYIKKL